MYYNKKEQVWLKDYESIFYFWVLLKYIHVTEMSVSFWQHRIPLYPTRRENLHKHIDKSGINLDTVGYMRNGLSK
jgi:hypothetical protein